MGLSLPHLLGAILTIIAIIAIGVYSGKRIKNAADFSFGSRQGSSLLVVGVITGTFVGGASTIGTAQLAFSFGLSAWWFTLGGGIACLVLGLTLIKPVRATGCDTVQQMINKEYGAATGLITTVLGTISLLTNIITQLLSFNALVISVIPIDPFISALFGIGLMLCYVIFGGVLGAGILGLVKLSLIYFSIILSAGLVLYAAKGFFPIYNALPNAQFYNLFARSIGIDAGAGLSVVLGVLCTQTYIQAVLSARNDKIARKGTLLSALLIPPIGAGGILVGHYMRLTQPYMNPALAFPQFIIEYLPPLLGGVALAALLITVTGTGAGLALGFGTIITNNIYLRFFNKERQDKKTLKAMRLLILFALLVAVVFTLGNLDSVIMNWGFLSMALRSSVLLVPMFAALFLRSRVEKQFVLASSVLGLAAVVLSTLTLSQKLDPVFLGISVSAATVLLGVLVNYIKRSYRNI